MASANISAHLALYAIGFLIRLIILNSESLSKSLGNRVEISTPLTSWKRAVEGVALRKQGINPYDGDIFHESPLALIFYDSILSHVRSWIPIIFSISDLLSAAALSLAAHFYLKDCCKKESKPSKFPPKSELLLLKPSDVQAVPFYVSAMYLLCPYSIISCGGKSTSVFFNTFISFFLLFTSAGLWPVAPMILGLLSYHSFYHVSLLVPLVMLIHQKSNQGKNTSGGVFKLICTVIIYFCTLIFLMYLSNQITGSWKFLWSTYGCILSVPDLTPNIGLFWYFFTEMFEHFRVFFVCTFQLNVFVYTVPLAIRLRKEPVFLLFIHLIIIAIFKSYPSIGDIAFYLAFLPVWSHLFHFMRQGFIVCCGLASCTLLAPTLWYLWIYSGSANANFYFAITLVFNTAQVFLLTDLLSAYIKREYYLENGVKYNDDGSLVLMRLQ